MTVAVAIRNLSGMTGAAALVLQQLRYMAAAGYRTEVLGERLNRPAIEGAGGIPIGFRRLALPQWISRRWFSRQIEWRRRRLGYHFLIGHGDILHQDALFVHNLVAREAELLGEIGPRKIRPIENFHAELFERRDFRVLITHSHLAGNDLIRRYGLSPDLVRVVYPGCDTGRFNIRHRFSIRQQVRAELHLEHEFLVAFVTSGYFSMRGADTLVATLLRLPERIRKTIRILAVGASHNTAALRRDFAAAGLEAYLLVRPKITDVQNYYYASDLLFHPARLETFGLVALEAAACGTPVLMSRSVGAAEFLDKACTDTVPEPDATSFAESLEALILDRQQLAELAVRQQVTAVSRTSTDYAAECAKILREYGL